MLGWEYFIKRRQNSQLLGRWVTLATGSLWIDDMAAKGMAKSLGGDGYPYQYELPARNLIVAYEDGIAIDRPGPRSKTDLNRVGAGDLDTETLKSLDADETLSVEVWDQS